MPAGDGKYVPKVSRLCKACQRGFAYLYPLVALGLIAGGLATERLALSVPGALMWLDFQGVFDRFRRPDRRSKDA